MWYGRGGEERDAIDESRGGGGDDADGKSTWAARRRGEDGCRETGSGTGAKKYKDKSRKSDHILVRERKRWCGNSGDGGDGGAAGGGVGGEAGEYCCWWWCF